MSTQDINQRLLSPIKKVTLPEFAAAFHYARITLVLEGMGAFVQEPSLLNKVRGALGARLAAGASEEFLARRPCPWSPPCAAEVFFAKKPALTYAGFHSEIPKPYVLSTARNRNNLHIFLDVFGFALDWLPVLYDQLAASVKEDLHWHLLAQSKSLFLPAAITIKRMQISHQHLDEWQNPPGASELVMCSAMDREHGSIAKTPELIVDRLARRLVSMARWYDRELLLDWDVLQAAKNSCTFELTEIHETQDPIPLVGGHKMKNQLDNISGLHISGTLDALWTLLRLGEVLRFGRGTTVGLGQYKLLRCCHIK